VERYCQLREEEEALLERAFKEKHLSARGYHKILKVARTIADLEGSKQINKIHLCEAISYRDLEEKYWGRRI